MIGFAGLSHLGIVSSVAAAMKGHEVVAFDPDVSVCEALRGGRPPVVEPGLPEAIKASSGRLKWTSNAADLASCEIIFISKDVVTDSDNHSDLGPVTMLGRQIAPVLKKQATLVLLSQIPPGFSATFAQEHADRGLNIFCQVETLIFGRAMERALSPERFIVGLKNPEAALPKAYLDYLSSFGCPVLPMRYESAELAKISINLCLVSSVSTANTLAELCEAVGAEWSEIVPALRLDKRIGPQSYLSPGLGLSGGNLERDLATVSALAGEHGTDARVVDAWLGNSAHRRNWTIKMIHSKVLAIKANPVIALLGLAYKANTHSIKNSPAIELLGHLSKFQVKAYDPVVRLDARSFSSVSQVNSALEACRQADALVVMTPWEEFSAIDLNQLCAEMKGRVLIDPLGVLDRQKCRKLGFLHLRLGSSPQTGASAQ